LPELKARAVSGSEVIPKKKKKKKKKYGSEVRIRRVVVKEVRIKSED
jgi:hypothetical protein